MRLMVLFGIVFAVCIYGADKRACGPHELLQNAPCQTFPEPKRWVISFMWEHAWKAQEIRDECT